MFAVAVTFTMVVGVVIRVATAVVVAYVYEC